MEISIKHMFFIIISTLCSCSVEPDQPIQPKPDPSDLLLGTWTYDYVEAQGDKYALADANMELGNQIGSLGGNRAQLFRRQIHYSEDGTYQLRWSERGDYGLGTQGTDNWQPSFGYWELEGNTLIHNKGTAYEKTYLALINEDRFQRSADRLMLESHPFVTWQPDEVVYQTEVFKKE